MMEGYTPEQAEAVGKAFQEAWQKLSEIFNEMSDILATTVEALCVAHEELHGQDYTDCPICMEEFDEPD